MFLHSCPPGASYLDGLTITQKEAATSDTPILFINAGPGSGKTRVLTSRVAYFVLEKHIPPQNMAVLTFTNKAANEMKHRLQATIGTEKCVQLKIGTFHTFCNRLIREHGLSIGLDPHFSIFDANDSLAAMKKVLGKMSKASAAMNAKQYLDKIKKYKAKNSVPVNEEKPKFPKDNIVEVYHAYEMALKEARALDFDDLLIWGLRLLQSDKKIAERMHRVLIDEYQDTNFIQNEITLELSSFHSHLTVVLDPDQSIYQWRSADIQNFNKLKARFPNSHMMNLEQNFRSTKAILQFANKCIIQDTSRPQKALFTDNPLGPPIYLRGKKTPHNEAAFVADQIANFVTHANGAVEYKDFSVLVRASSLTHVIEEMFTKKKIPFTMVGGLRFFDRAEIKDIVSYLRLIQNPYDKTALLRIINVPSRKIGDATINKLLDAEKALNLPAYDVLQRLAEKESVPGFKRASAGITKFFGLIQSFRKESEEGTFPSLVKKIIEDINYAEYLKTNFPQNFEDKIENLDELIRTVTDFATGPNYLAEFLEMIAVSSEEILPSQVDPSADHSKVTICTLHASKGLEWPFVFIVGADERNIPHALCNNDSAKIAEERRLLYVGITRAKTLLYITWPKTRRITGDMSGNDSFALSKSPFLSFCNNSRALSQEVWTKQTPRFTKELYECFLKTNSKEIRSSSVTFEVDRGKKEISESEELSDDPNKVFHANGAYDEFDILDWAPITTPPIPFINHNKWNSPKKPKAFPSSTNDFKSAASLISPKPKLKLSKLHEPNYCSQRQAHFSSQTYTNISAQHTSNYSSQPSSNVSSQHSSNYSSQQNSNVSTRTYSNFPSHHHPNFSSQPYSNFSNQHHPNSLVQQYSTFSPMPQHSSFSTKKRKKNWKPFNLVIAPPFKTSIKKEPN